MKAHFKIVCVVMLMLCLVAENESWWLKRSRSSRGSSSSLSSSSSSSRRRSSSSSSSRYRSSSGSSSRRRRGWFIRRRPAQVKSTVKSQYKYGYNYGYPYGLSRASPSGCQWRYGYDYYGCMKTVSKATRKTPEKVSTPVPVKSAEVSKPKVVALITIDCTTQLGRHTAIPSWILHKLLNKPQCCKKVLETIIAMGLAKKKSTSSRPPSVFQEVKRKYVKSLTTVERPFNDRKNGKYGEDAITCLKRYGIKTSISGNSDTITHSGVLVTTEDDKTYLIHKLKGKNARVEYRPNLFDDARWKSVKTIKPKRRLTINDYYNSIEPNRYNLWTSNCHHATEWMVQLAG